MTSVEDKISALRRHGKPWYSEVADTLEQLNDFQNSQCYQLLARLNESQRREKAAVEDLYASAPCFACVNFRRNSGECIGGGRCRFVDEVAERYPDGFEWRGPEEAQHGEN